MPSELSAPLCSPRAQHCSPESNPDFVHGLFGTKGSRDKSVLCPAWCPCAQEPPSDVQNTQKALPAALGRKGRFL